MVGLLITIVKLLVIILCVATIHEFGHFLASKCLKTGVDEFSIGFGPKVFQKKFKGTMYSLRWLPLGGYCAIEGEGGEESEEDKKDENKEPAPTSYQARKWWEKIIILSMGVIFNFILATVVFLCVYLPGNVATTTIQELSEDSVLIEAGLQAGDRIVSINGKKIELYSQLSNYELKSGVTDATIEYERDGQVYTAQVKNAQTKEGKIGITFVQNEQGDNTNQIELVGAGTPAAKVGIKSGDIILSIDDVSTPDAKNVVQEIKNKGDQEIKVVVQRGEETKEFKLVAESKEVMDLGIRSVSTTKSSIKYSFIETTENIKNIVGSYVKLFTGKVSIGNMSGIVGIGEVVSKSSGLLNFFYLMAMISMAVGVANILPFPPLDGGKIVIVLIEAITRKKVSEKVELIISYIGLALLLGLTLFVTIKDIIRII